MPDKESIEGDAVLEEISSKVAEAILNQKENPGKWEISALQDCLSKIQELHEENSSLWFMLDEINQSKDWSEDHSEELKKAINRQIAMLSFTKKGDA